MVQALGGDTCVMKWGGLAALQLHTQLCTQDRVAVHRAVLAIAAPQVLGDLGECL